MRTETLHSHDAVYCKTLVQMEPCLGHLMFWRGCVPHRKGKQNQHPTVYLYLRNYAFVYESYATIIFYSLRCQRILCCFCSNIHIIPSGIYPHVPGYPTVLFFPSLPLWLVEHLKIKCSGSLYRQLNAVWMFNTKKQHHEGSEIRHFFLICQYSVKQHFTGSIQTHKLIIDSRGSQTMAHKPHAALWLHNVGLT